MFERGFKTWCERLSLQHRTALKLQPTDPLDARTLANYLNVLVWFDYEVPNLNVSVLNILKMDSSSWSALTIPHGKSFLIILNSSHSAARQSSDLTHELSHIIRGHEPSRVDVSEDNMMLLHTFDRKLEDEANWLAGCLLLPREALLLARKKRLPDDQIMERYRVSSEMLQYRIRVSGVDVQLKRRAVYKSR